MHQEDPTITDDQKVGMSLEGKETVVVARGGVVVKKKKSMT